VARQLASTTTGLGLTTPLSGTGCVPPPAPPAGSSTVLAPRRARGAAGFSQTTPLPQLRKSQSSPSFKSRTVSLQAAGLPENTRSHSEALDFAAVDAGSWLAPTHATMWSPSQSVAHQSCRLTGIRPPSTATWIGVAASGGQPAPPPPEPAPAPPADELGGTIKPGELGEGKQKLSATMPDLRALKGHAAAPLVSQGHIPWGQLVPHAKANLMTTSRRLVDRSRDQGAQWEDGEDLVLNDKAHSNGSLASTMPAGGMSQLEMMEEQAWEMRRRFSAVRQEPVRPMSPPRPMTRGRLPLHASSFDITKGSRLADLVLRGAIGVVKSSYFEDCILNKRTISRRQEIPNPLMWIPEEAVANWRRYGKCFMIVVSYSWLTPTHPDPEQFHLKKLVRIMHEYMKLWSIKEVGVLMDYCSLWQGGLGGIRDTRTKDQREQADQGAAEFVMAYGHKAITSVQLTAVPKGVTRKYEDRGWTLLETIAIDCKGGDWNRWIFQDLDPDTTQYPDATVFFLHARKRSLRPPLTPKDFQEALEERRAKANSGDSDVEVPLFINHQDEKRVMRMYQDVLGLICLNTRLVYDGAQWGDLEALKFVKVLAGCKNLEHITLYDNRVGQLGADAIANVVPRFHDTLKILGLRGNPLCKDPKAANLLRLIWSREGKSDFNLVL